MPADERQPADDAVFPPPRPTFVRALDNGPDDRSGEEPILSATMRDLLEADRSILVVIGFDGHPIEANDVALSLLGATTVADLAPGTAAGSTLASLLDHLPVALRTSAGVGSWSGDLDFRLPDGRTRLLRCTASSRRDASLPTGGALALIAHDVTDARSHNADLLHRSLHDPLTGLANRRKVLGTLENEIARQRETDGNVAVLFIDLDRLKYVNDALGHAVGDRLLVSTAERLVDAVRPADRVARIGGDEFLVVCADMPDTDTALELADRVCAALTGRLHVNRLELEFSVSVGVALVDDELASLDDADIATRLISNADAAMYEAKSTGRGKSVLFNAEMRHDTFARTQLATSLSESIANSELHLEFQPLFSAVTSRVVAAEALVRWTHPTYGAVNPSTFIPVAEDAGLIARLGESVLRQALHALRSWRDSGVVGEEFAVHVNVSPIQLASASFTSVVMGTLASSGLEPHDLVLEASESALSDNRTDVERTVQALRRLGVRIAVDNFGTGTNALSVLTEVGADLLKLDGPLGLAAGSTDTDVRVVRAVVLLAHALGMEVVAERVSGNEQLRRLRAAGCDYIQGNLLGGPTSTESFVASTTA